MQQSNNDISLESTNAHEHLIQVLSSVLLQLHSLQTLLRNNETQPDLNAIRNRLSTVEQMTQEALYEIRSANDDDLLLPNLVGVTLVEALARAVEETAEALGLSSRITFTGEERPLPSYTERLIYRVAQEALYQMQQQSNARKLRFTLSYARDEMQMSIEDDGVMSLPNTDEEQPLPAVLNGTATNALAHTEEISASAKIHVLIVDDQAVSRAGLHRLLESYPGLQVVGEAADGVQAVSETLELGPQVVLLDANLPNGQSMEALKQIKQLNLDTRVLLFAAQDREGYLYETLRAGADGYILKDIVPDELARAVRVVASGEVLVQSQLAGRLLSRFGKQGRGSAPYETLTAREQEVLRLLARGLRNKEIAARLVVSERTVNFHLANIYHKLNVSGRTEALSKALEQGLISA